MTGDRLPFADEAPKLNVTISIAEIYNALCPACREALVNLMAGKTKGAVIQDVLRRQLEAPARSEGLEDRRREHS